MSLVAIHGASLGAGPGPVRTYRVDLPFPWGDDTEITLPIQSITFDAVNAAYPQIRTRLDHDIPAIAERFVASLEPTMKRVEDRLDRTMTQAYVLGAMMLVGFGLLWYGRQRR